MTSWRCDGVVGLKVFSAIGQFQPYIPVVTSILLALGQRHDRLLVVGAPARPAPEALDLALDADRVDRRHLDLEQRLRPPP